MAPDTDPPVDAARAKYERSEELLAIRKQEREAQATERELEERLETFGADVHRTRKAEEDEYTKEHFGHGRETTGDGD